MGYPFKSEFRAQCVNVVDGDTVDLVVDRGFHDFRRERFRFYRINCWEMKSPVEADRVLAQRAKKQVEAWMKPRTVPDFERWDLRIITMKDSDNFGRWLAEIYFMEGEVEVNANDKLLELGLALPYKRK